MTHRSCGPIEKYLSANAIRLNIMEEWVAVCRVAENEDDENSQITHIGIARAAELAITPKLVDVPTLAPQIFSGVVRVSVLHKVGADTRYVNVRAFLRDARWVLETDPDGDWSGNLRSPPR